MNDSNGMENHPTSGSLSPLELQQKTPELKSGAVSAFAKVRGTEIEGLENAVRNDNEILCKIASPVVETREGSEEQEEDVNDETSPLGIPSDFEIDINVKSVRDSFQMWQQSPPLPSPPPQMLRQIFSHCKVMPDSPRSSLQLDGANLAKMSLCDRQEDVEGGLDVREVEESEERGPGIKTVTEGSEISETKAIAEEFNEGGEEVILVEEKNLNEVVMEEEMKESVESGEQTEGLPKKHGPEIQEIVGGIDDGREVNERVEAEHMNVMTEVVAKALTECREDETQNLLEAYCSVEEKDIIGSFHRAFGREETAEEEGTRSLQLSRSNSLIENSEVENSIFENPVRESHILENDLEFGNSPRETPATENELENSLLQNPLGETQVSGTEFGNAVIDRLAGENLNLEDQLNEVKESSDDVEQSSPASTGFLSVKSNFPKSESSSIDFQDKVEIHTFYKTAEFLKITEEKKLAVSGEGEKTGPSLENEGLLLVGKENIPHSSSPEMNISKNSGNEKRRNPLGSSNISNGGSSVGFLHALEKSSILKDGIRDSLDSLGGQTYSESGFSEIFTKNQRSRVDASGNSDLGNIF